MKKFIMYIVIAIVIVSSAFGVYKITSEYRIGILTDNIDCNIILKGCENAKGITMIDNNIFVAFTNTIIEVDGSGKEKIIFKDKSYNIEDIESIDSKIYILTDDKIIEYSKERNEIKEVIRNIPSEGDRLSRDLLVVGEKLYLGVSSTTNDGIAISAKNSYDFPPYEVVLGEGVKKNMVPFKPYGEIGKPGERIKGKDIGNNSVYSIDIKNKKVNLIATGIKKIVGWDYNSQNQIYMAVQGIEDGGVRNVVRDRDYIFRLENDTDYGFPDYSGGDPISSPRFSKESEIKFLLESSTKKSIPFPLYQHNSVAGIEGLAIDRSGSVFSKDTKIFFDKKEGVVGTLSSNNVYVRVLKLNEDTNVEKILYDNGRLLILDSGVGCLYEITNKVGFLGFNLSPVVWIVIISITLVIFIIGVLKFLNRRKA